MNLLLHGKYVSSEESFRIHLVYSQFLKLTNEETLSFGVLQHMFFLLLRVIHVMHLTSPSAATRKMHCGISILHIIFENARKKKGIKFVRYLIQI